MNTRTRPLANAVHHALTSSAPTSAPPPQKGFSLIETVVAAALVTVLAAGVYTVYQPTQGLAQVQTQTSMLDQLKTGVERSFGSAANYSNVSFSAAGTSNQQGSSPPNWIPQGLTNTTNWGAITIGPAQTNVANDSWQVSFPTVPTRDCQQAVIHELNNWNAITVNGTLVSDAQSTLDACAATTNGKNVVAFTDYQGALAGAGNAFVLPPGTGTPQNPPPGAPTPPVNAINPGPAAAPPSVLPTTPTVGPAAGTPSPAGPGVAMPPPSGSAPAPTYPSTCTIPAPLTQTLACPSGQLGSIVQTETASCPNPYAAAVWGPWTTTSNTCSPACVAPAPATGSQTASCPSGQVTSTGATTVGQTQSITYACPAPTGTYTVAYGPWSPATSSVCAPKCTAPGPTTNSQTASCPAGQVTSAGASTFAQTQTVTYSCPAPQGGYVASPGAWSPAATSVCAPQCVAPAPQQQWAACPAGQAVPGPFPANYYGVQQQRNGICPAPTGPGSYGGWYNTGYVACAPVCVAPGSWTNTQTQWFTQYLSCPSGWSGTVSYEIQEQSSQTISYSCNQVTGPATQNNGPWGPWTATGAPIQNYQFNCTMNCVSVDAFVHVRREGVEMERRAGDVRVGDELRLMNPKTGAVRWGQVSVSETSPAECVQVVTASGLTLVCSASAPLGLADGGQVVSVDAKGHRVALEVHGAYRVEEVVDVIPMGRRDVQLITCENDFFLAGDQSGCYFTHHNKKIGFCVSPQSFVLVRRDGQEQVIMAGDVKEGDELRLMNPRDGAKRWGVVSRSTRGQQPGVTVTTSSQATLTCSTTAPLGLVNGRQVLASQAYGHIVALDDLGIYGGDRVVKVANVGLIEVQSLVCEDAFFLVGDQPNRFFAHHD